MSRALLLHGFMGQPSDWDFLASQYDDVSIPDLHDDLSPSPTGRGVRGEVLVGYSMGARLALQMVLAHPDRFSGALIISGSPGLEHENERAQRRAADAVWIEKLRSLPFEQFLDEWYAQPVFAGQRVQRCEKPEAYVQSLEQFGLGVQAPVWHLLPHNRVPMTFMCGERDTKFVAIAQRMHAMCPNSKLVIVPDAGHNILLDNPNAISSVCMKYFDHRPNL